jgi:RNA 2',3'-cyclic 3'-phosphodiesterase
LDGLPANPRLFVAVELPGEVLGTLTRLQHELQRHDLRGLRWVRPEGIHLTLKFLGETPRQRMNAVGEALAQATKGVGPHDLSLGSMGTFGSRNSPRVLWVDLEGDVETLRRLQQQIDGALDAIGFPGEKRPFAAHLTLARVRPELAPEIAEPLAEAVRSVSVPHATIPVHDVSLMLSKLGPGGAVYTRVESRPLTG